MAPTNIVAPWLVLTHAVMSERHVAPTCGGYRSVIVPSWDTWLVHVVVTYFTSFLKSW